MKNKILSFLKSKTFLSPLVCSLSFVLVLLLDLLTKGLLIPKYMPNVGDSMKVIPGFISFIYVKNKGAAWGIMQNGTIFLSIVSLIGSLAILAFYVVRLIQAKEKSSILLAIVTGLIVGGAIGNLVDRLAFGYVRDFINFDFMNFPVFNFADSAITVGIIMFIFYLAFSFQKETPDIQIFTKKDKKDENVKPPHEDKPDNDETKGDDDV